MTEGCVVLVTLPDEEVATRICRTLVEERLVACGNIIPGVRSIYRWEDEIREESEWLVMLKTSANVLSKLMRRVADLHPYEVPEILALPVASGHTKYLEWVMRSTQVGP
jgi:periplasmic divalent cation tolerance protein